MRIHTLFFCFLLFISGFQSLVDLAKKEAERRKQIDEQGIEVKVITQSDAKLAPEGAISVSSIPDRFETAKSSEKPAKKHSLEKFRDQLNRFDREIRACEERLISTRRRLESERRNFKKSGTKQKSQTQIQDLETKIARLKEERLKSYNQARRAGYLPDELDGRYIMP